jgi:hypothetical protein
MTILSQYGTDIYSEATVISRPGLSWSATAAGQYMGRNQGGDEHMDLPRRSRVPHPRPRRAVHHVDVTPESSWIAGPESLVGRRGTNHPLEVGPETGYPRSRDVIPLS